MTDIKNNIAIIRNRIKASCIKAGRQPGEIKLLLATKTISANDILVAFKEGETIIGENKVQELKEKFDALQPVAHQTHFIGHLQTNKIKEVIKYADCIQSVDRLELAEKLQRRLEFEDRTMDIFLQVNTSYEESKFGMLPDHAVKLALQFSKLDRLHIKGLMTIGLFSAEISKVRKCFQLLKRIQTELLDAGIPVTELSMGMSNDLETAIEEGSTMIRVGTAIFGKRPFPDSYYWNETKEPPDLNLGSSPAAQGLG
ncbi:MAG: YggS family pyridoxal phosphate-dependent enzyme [Terrimonas sp.]|nr:YggS family pyridoxal phosphate-dependent enzyme [Terrimonas sp.]OJY79640.1 MAG: YggS family pyridoxal phosphate enzyme [Sphingobacteriales bacterium 40-81]